MKQAGIRAAVALLALQGVALHIGADEVPTKEGVAKIAAPQFSPYAGRNYPTRVLFGDTHLHTAVSVDAGTMCRVGQEDAFASPAERRSARPTVCAHGCRVRSTTS